MAPEMMDRKPFDVFAADIWSSGIVCLEDLSGVNVVPKMVFKDFLPCPAQPKTVLTGLIGVPLEQPGSVRKWLFGLFVGSAVVCRSPCGRPQACSICLQRDCVPISLWEASGMQRCTGVSLTQSSWWSGNGWVVA